jgi:hypothetical protein
MITHAARTFLLCTALGVAANGCVYPPYAPNETHAVHVSVANRAYGDEQDADWAAAHAWHPGQRTAQTWDVYANTPVYAAMPMYLIGYMVFVPVSPTPAATPVYGAQPYVPPNPYAR